MNHLLVIVNRYVDLLYFSRVFFVGYVSWSLLIRYEKSKFKVYLKLKIEIDKITFWSANLCLN